MPKIEIDASGCRYCSLCAEICPVQVFDMDEKQSLARATRPNDCIGCVSCVYICPSRCLAVSDVQLQRPFHRMELNKGIVSKLLQQAPIDVVLTDEDIEEAMADITERLVAFSESLDDALGRGRQAAGRKAGTLAAAHLPEMYEGKNLGEVLARMKSTWAGSFDFDAVVSPNADEIEFEFTHSVLDRIINGRAAQPSKSAKQEEQPLIVLFKEYWAGLLSSFTGRNYGVKPGKGGSACNMKLVARE